MRKLLDFLIDKRHWFLFFFLEVVSLLLVYRNHAYQQSVMLSTANELTAHIISLNANLTSYLDLKGINKDLEERNGRLEMENLRLRQELAAMEADTSLFRGNNPDSAQIFPYATLPAKVVNNSVAYLSNYITINKGKSDGLHPDMGVLSSEGVVGIISTVSEHYAVVIPILNPKFRLSCKVAGSNYFGSMSWNGRDISYAQLEELPRHVAFQVGDTIVTSGYSSIFPEGVRVGTVSSFKKQRNDNFYALTVKLASDFHDLGTVLVIRNYHQKERKQLEQEAGVND